MQMGNPENWFYSSVAHHHLFEFKAQSKVVYNGYMDSAFEKCCCCYDGLRDRFIGKVELFVVVAVVVNMLGECHHVTYTVVSFDKRFSLGI